MYRSSKHKSCMYECETSSSSLLIGRRPVYTSVSLRLFIGRPRFLFPTAIPSCTLIINRPSVIRDMCMLHSVLLLCTQEVMFWISHISRIFSFLIQIPGLVTGSMSTNFFLPLVGC
jgi:hypothetical protein